MGAAAAWKDGEHWYILRRVTSEQQLVTTPTNSDEVRLIHEGGIAFCRRYGLLEIMPSAKSTTGTPISPQRVKLSNSFKKGPPKYLCLK